MKAVFARVQVLQVLLQLFGVVAHRAELIEQERRPFRPQRTWRKIAGPGEVRRISSAIAAMNGASTTSPAAAISDVGDALHQQADFVVGRGGKGEQRRVAEAIERDGAVDVREEIHRHARAHALFVAEQEDFFQIRQALAAHGEDDFVDHVLPQDGRQIARSARPGTDRASWISAGASARSREETAQPDAVFARTAPALAPCGWRVPRCPTTIT